MKLRIVQTFDTAVSEKLYLIDGFLRELENFILQGDYGNEIEVWMIGLVVVNPPPGFEHLHKAFKPKFTEYKAITNKFTGERMEIIKQFHYGFKIDGDQYGFLMNSNELEAKKFFGRLIYESLDFFNKLPKQCKSFNSELLKSDVLSFLKSRNLF